jgi:hypothetical protein
MTETGNASQSKSASAGAAAILWQTRGGGSTRSTVTGLPLHHRRPGKTSYENAAPIRGSPATSLSSRAAGSIRRLRMRSSAAHVGGSPDRRRERQLPRAAGGFRAQERNHCGRVLCGRAQARTRTSRQAGEAPLRLPVPFRLGLRGDARRSHQTPSRVPESPEPSAATGRRALGTGCGSSTSRRCAIPSHTQRPARLSADCRRARRCSMRWAGWSEA